MKELHKATFVRCCEAAGADVEGSLNAKHTRENVMARWYYYAIMRKYTDLSLTALGSHLNQDHTTVIHALKNLDHLHLTDRHTRETYEQLLKDCVEISPKALYDQKIERLYASLVNENLAELWHKQ